MTARWSGVCCDNGGNANVGADLEVEMPAGFPTAARRVVSGSAVSGGCS